MAVDKVVPKTTSPIPASSKAASLLVAQSCENDSNMANRLEVGSYIYVTIGESKATRNERRLMMMIWMTTATKQNEYHLQNCLRFEELLSKSGDVTLTNNCTALARGH